MDPGIAGRVAVVTGGDEEFATLPLDLTVEDSGEQMLGAALEAFGGVDILVNAITPAAVQGSMWPEPGDLLDQHVEKTGAADRESALAELHAARPDERLATVEEIAAAIVFPCSERASYVSGAAWSVDAGTVQVII